MGRAFGADRCVLSFVRGADCVDCFDALLCWVGSGRTVSDWRVVGYDVGAVGCAHLLAVDSDCCDVLCEYCSDMLACCVCVYGAD